MEFVHSSRAPDDFEWVRAANEMTPSEMAAVMSDRSDHPWTTEDVTAVMSRERRITLDEARSFWKAFGRGPSPLIEVID